MKQALLMIKKTYKYNPTPGDELTAYDKDSIMHYDGTLRGYFSTPIMKDKITGKGIGVNRKLSQTDIQKLNQMYPCTKPSVPICGELCLALKAKITALNGKINYLDTENRGNGHNI